MNDTGLAIKVRSGPDLLFSCTKPLVGTDNSTKNVNFVSSLREAQTQVNQFLTELVEKSGTPDQKQGQSEEASDEDDEDDEDDEEEDDKVPKAVILSKRKAANNDKNGSSSNCDGTLGKRLKS